MRLLHSHQFSRSPTDPALKERLDGISESELRAWVERLALPRHFTAEPAQNRSIGESLFNELVRLGFEVEWQGSSRNIIARPPGPFQETVLVGAHYDSVPACPGADDNASAVAALLVAARVIREFQHAPPVVFCCFNREEDGFAGSTEFVAAHVVHKPYRIRCAHILEMLGYASDAPGSQRLPTGLPIQLRDRGDFLGFLANDASAPEMCRIIEKTATYIPELPATGLQVVPGAERLFPVLARSDHVPFWRNEIPAVMWTDTAEFRNPNYHRSTDTPETLDYAFLAGVTRALAASLLQ